MSLSNLVFNLVALAIALLVWSLIVAEPTAIRALGFAFGWLVGALLSIPIRRAIGGRR